MGFAGFFQWLFPFLFQGDQACENCAGSSFTSIAAAFSTLGYYAQAGWLQQIFDYGMSNWAILLYVIAAIAFIISMAMGQPPKAYMWLIIGPAVFYWLTENRTPVTGVAWRVGSGDNGLRDMKEVWRLAETGLVNDWYILHHGFRVSSEHPPTFGGGGCYSAACVSDFFAFFDRLVSDTIQNLIEFVGVSRVHSNDGFLGTTKKETNIMNSISKGVQKWDLTSSLRWEFFQSITDAHLRNADVRQAFSTFMAGECGDAFVESVDRRNMVALTNSTKGQLATTNFLKTKDNTLIGVPFHGPMVVPKAYKLWDNLATKQIPTPDAVKRLMNPDINNIVGKESRIRGGGDALIDTSDEEFATSLYQSINCRTYFVLVMQAMRWEAAHQAYHVMNSGPVELEDSRDFLAHMLYGVDIKNPDNGEQIGVDDAQGYIENLIFASLFKNELIIAPAQVVEKRFTSGQQTVQNVKDFQRVNNQRAKYGELYTWALMVPYFQGQLLYFLAIAYPFACMMVVLPGMHKTIFTWMQHWVWVKMWDLGFAVVMVLERTIWSMLVNKYLTADVNNVVMVLDKINTSTVDPSPPTKLAFLPNSVDIPMLAETNIFGSTGDSYGLMLDKLLALSTNINLDLSNSYYIYIMSALYFSVPVITGTLVLGAKSGIASMIGSTLGQIAQPGGNAAGSAAVGEMQNRMQQAQAIGRQEAFAKEMRNSGLAAQAMGAANQATMQGISASGKNQLGSNYGARMQAMGDTIQSLTSAHGVTGQMANVAFRLMFPTAPGGLGAAAGAAGATGSGATGTGGDGATGVGVNVGTRGGPMTAARWYNGAKGLLSKGGQWGSAYISMGSAVARNEALQNFLGDVNAMRGQQVGYSNQAFGLQAEGQRLNLQGQRLQEASMFRGQQAEWNSAKSYSDQNSGFLSAIGGMSGSLGPGPAPTGMGMAWGGGLGGDARVAARAAGDGGAIQGNTFMWGGTLSQHGSSWVQDGYKPTSLHDAWDGSLKWSSDPNTEVNAQVQETFGWDNVLAATEKAQSEQK